MPPDYSDYTVKWAHLPWEQQQALKLRQQVFCHEQQLFELTDEDAVDQTAQSIVALGDYGGWPQQVVGTVRIHQQAAGEWWGGRLAVSRDFRHQRHLGTGLIRLAVGSAHALGCQRFLATVQAGNEALFQHLHWQTLERMTLHGRDHLLMQADLNFYPPIHNPNSGFVMTLADKPTSAMTLWPGLLEVQEQVPVPGAAASVSGAEKRYV